MLLSILALLLGNMRNDDWGNDSKPKMMNYACENRTERGRARTQNYHAGKITSAA